MQKIQSIDFGDKKSANEKPQKNNELSRNLQENRLRGTKSIQSPDNGVNRPILSLTFFDL